VIFRHFPLLHGSHGCGPEALARDLGLVPVAAVLLQMFLGLVLLTGGSGCGGDSAPPMTEENKQNINDELNAADAAKKTPGKAGQP
jgi:hypothetical protein